MAPLSAMRSLRCLDCVATFRVAGRSPLAASAALAQARRATTDSARDSPRGARKRLRAGAEGSAQRSIAEKQLRRGDRAASTALVEAPARAAGALPEGASPSPTSDARRTRDRDVPRAARATFPELPEPHNNLAVLYARRANYELARDGARARDRAPPRTTRSPTRTWATSTRASRSPNTSGRQRSTRRNKTAAAEAQARARRCCAASAPALIPPFLQLTGVTSRCCVKLSLFAAALALRRDRALAANPQVELDTTAGKIRIELYPDAAPKTVANFLDYVKSEALRRHAVPSRHRRLHDPGRRLHDRLQAEADASRRSPIEAESSSKAGLLNVPGTIAMARTSDPNSATSQFFINVADNKFLNFRSPDPQGYRLHGVRQGRRGHGRRQQDREGAEGRAGRSVPASIPATFPPTQVVINNGQGRRRLTAIK